jgi:oligopeptide/dipeptide ABC transporter ATP-binding protein
LFISHDLNVVGYLCSDVAVMYKGHIMEYAPADELFDNPHHPYTHLLLSAAPDSTTGEEYETVEDGAETPVDLTVPAGCSFRQKCPLKEPRCKENEDGLINVGKNHFIRCWRVSKTGETVFVP